MRESGAPNPRGTERERVWPSLIRGLGLCVAVTARRGAASEAAPSLSTDFVGFTLQACRSRLPRAVLCGPPYSDARGRAGSVSAFCIEAYIRHCSLHRPGLSCPGGGGGGQVLLLATCCSFVVGAALFVGNTRKRYSVAGSKGWSARGARFRRARGHG